MSTDWPSEAAQDSAQPVAPIEDVADTGEIADLAGEAEQPDLPPVPAPPTASRPPLQRNNLQGVPPAAPMAPPPSNDQPPATDSLSLQQLRHIVAEFNRAEPVAYDFEYTDIGPHAEEIDEWFNYQLPQWVRLSAAQGAFKWHWQHEARSQDSWDDADNDTRTRFVQTAIAGVQSNDAALRSASIGKLVYLVLGRWNDTAIPNATPGDSRSVASISQLQAIKAGVECLTSLDGLPVIWEALRNSFEVQWSGEPLSQHNSAQEAQDELMNLMTIMYIVIQETLNDPEDMASTYGKLLFGGTEELEAIKKATNEMGEKASEKKTITASPLDYHVFRQEITSKYPAYVPPRPAIPLEADNTSLLPPLSSQVSRNNGANGIIPAPPQVHNGGTSILDQPVHIATPAPSPPPSPAAGGKGGKKQNYQTNQNFPFMYPPLDASSNYAGGKGPAGIHQALIGRKWEGSDIPASILEAGELFSSRVRMTRATRQLWEERERFLKFERGYNSDEDDDDDIEGLDLNELTLEEQEILKEIKAETKAEEKAKNPVAPKPEIDYGPRPELLSERDKQRLIAVEKFYRDALPHLQSLVIVLLRPILLNVTAIVSQQPQQVPPAMGRGNPGMNGGPSANRQQQEMPGQNPPKPPTPELTLEEVDAARTREITSKAMTGILILLLKWLRISHVLKFEYMTQLLLDSNYVPLVLKLFAHQDVQQVVDSKMDRAENRDKTGSDVAQDDEDDEEIEESEDEAAPPPIKLRRPLPTQQDDDADSNSDGQASSTRPEVDELGYPLNSQPTEPITDFSRRNFFSLINYLRVMQKICKNKAHRNLLLVQYKSSTILRKSLKVPQPELRLYTLKLFKNQVPYCGRKWRQSNMRVITAIYLHCRPELRDEWLAGSDVDAEVDAALPLEQALRSLTHWLNIRRYPDKIAPDIRAAMRDEQDFFSRELEKLELNWTDGTVDEMSELEPGEAW
ncbi:Factor arrest protein 11 [Fusarium chlamydosporum]